MIYRGLRSDSRMLSPPSIPFSVFLRETLNSISILNGKSLPRVCFLVQTYFASCDVIVVALPRFRDSKFPRQVKKVKKKKKKKIVHCIRSSGNTQIYVEYYAHIRLLYVQAIFFYFDFKTVSWCLHT